MATPEKARAPSLPAAEVADQLLTFADLAQQRLRARVALLEERVATVEREARARDARSQELLAEAAAALHEARAALETERARSATLVEPQVHDAPTADRTAAAAPVAAPGTERPVPAVEPTVPAVAPTDPAAGVGDKVASGLRWKLIAQVVSQVSRVGVGLVLARLLTPEDFGLAALALAWSALALVLSDPSLTAALVQRRTITEADRSTVFWATIGAGLACTALGVALSGPIAAFYGDSAVQPLIMVESLTFFLVSLSAIPVALMTREMAFRGLEIREMAGTVVGGLVGLAAALMGAGAWAIIAQSVASAAIATALLWYFSPWRPHWLFSWASLRDSGSFGLKLFASRLLSFANLNADNLLVGRYLGASALGFYAIAYNVMYAPMARITTPIQMVMVPAFSRLQDDRERLGQAWLRGARLSAAVAMPAFLGMLAVAPDFVPVVLGARWDPAVPVLQLLCISGILQGIQLLQQPVLQGRGRAGSLLRFGLVSTPVNLAGFVIGMHWGIVGVAAGFAVARTLMVPVITRMTCKEVGLPLRAFPKALASVALGAVAMCVIVVLARLELTELGVPSAARLVLLTALGIAFYLGYLIWRAPDIVTDLRRLRSRRQEA